MAFSLPTLLNLASSLAVLLFGALVLTVAPRRDVNRAFGVYAAGFSGGTIIANLQNADIVSSTGIFDVARGALYLLGGAGVVILALVILRDLDIRDRRPPLWAAGLSGAFLVTFAITGVTGITTDLFIVTIGFGLLLAGGWFAALAFGLAWRRADEKARLQLPLLSAALSLYSILYAMADVWPVILGARDSVSWILLTRTLILLLALAGAWLWNSAAATDGTPRNVALLALAVSVAAAWAWPNCDHGVSLCGTPAGVRVVAFALLAYAIVRHHLLGIDVKVRWTISKSTIAAVFIAVFFIASETAQQFFGETLGSTYIGIAAAGMLVFTMAPLQRVAERLAERAVPVAPAPSPIPASNSEREHYRVLLRRFLADGRMTRDEERALARVATLAGMTPDDTLAARHEVQAEIEEAERA